MALVLCVLGLGEEGRWDRLEMELMAEGKAEVKSLRRRLLVALSSRLTEGRSGTSVEKSCVLGSSLLRVWR
jgi:hypothetical protein